MTADVNMRTFIVVNREMMEEKLEALNIGARVLARRSNAMWEILLATEKAAKALTGGVHTTKTLRLQTGYMGPGKPGLPYVHHGGPFRAFFSDH